MSITDYKANSSSDKNIFERQVLQCREEAWVMPF